MVVARYDLLVFSLFPSLSQPTFGVGSPVATQVRTEFCPSFKLWSGCVPAKLVCAVNNII